MTISAAKNSEIKYLESEIRNVKFQFLDLLPQCRNLLIFQMELLDEISRFSMGSLMGFRIEDEILFWD